MPKQCIACGLSKPEAEFYVDGRSGKLRSKCKACFKAITSRQTPRTPEQRADYARRSGLRSGEYVPQADRQARAEAKRQERTAARQRQVEERACSPSIGTVAWYAAASPDQLASYRREKAAEARARYHADPVTQRRRVKRYKRQHPDVVARHQAARALRVATFADGSVSQTEVNKLIAAATDCTYCGTRLDPRHTMVDHHIPLARGGAHSLGNLVVCCSTCNLSKGWKLPWEWGAAQAA